MKRFFSGPDHGSALPFSSMIAICIFALWLLPAYHVLAAENIRVGVYDNPPKVFLTQNGIAAGIYPDILNAIAKQRGWSLHYVPGTWQECMDRLKSKQIDILVDIARTEERIAYLRYSQEPILTDWGAVYTRKGTAIFSFQEMKGKSIAVVRGSTHTQGVRGFKHLMELFGIPCRYVEVDSYRKALMLLDSAQVDASVVNRLFGSLYAEDYDVTATPLIFSPKVLLFAGHKDEERSGRFLRQIDESLKRLKQEPDSIFHRAMGYYLSGGRHPLQETMHAIDLSKEEQLWIRQHPVIRIGIDPHFSPFEFLSKQGKFTGMAADYLALISRKTGLTFQQVDLDSWQKALEGVHTRSVDLLPCLVNTQARQQFLSFSDPYIQFSRVIITAMDASLGRQNGLKGLEGLRVGVQADSSHHDFLRESSDLTPVLFDTFENAIMALSRGKVDAVIGNLAVAQHAIKKLSLVNLEFAGYAAPEPQSLSMGARKDWPELTAILNHALSSITFREKSRILSKWFPLPTEAHNNIGLTREEREWLLLNPRIKVAWDRHWAPVEFADKKGLPQGISMEYLTAIEKMLGVEFDMGHDSGWQTLEQQVENREIDMFSCVAITPRRMAHLEFTEAYLSLPVVVFARNNMAYVRDISELSDKKVAVVAGYAVDQWVSNDYPEFDIQRVATIEEGFTLLNREKADAFLCNVLPGNYYLSRLKRHDIKIAGETPYTHKLRMAVRKDWPLLPGILQKALNALPEAEKTYFYRKWALVKYEKGFDYDLFKKVMVFMALLVAAIVIWNSYMRAEINRRKKVEARLEIREQELQQKNEALLEMETLKDNLAHMIVHDMRSPLSGISGGLDLLTHRLSTLQPDKGIEQVLLMSRNGVDTLNRMMQSLLDIFKLESNELPLNLSPQDLRETAANVLKGMQGQARMYHQELVLTGSTAMGCFDPEIIRRVMTNLVENALKASPRDGRVEIHTRTDQNDIIAEVRDSGHGIPPEFQNRIFDKFSKLETGGAPAVSSYGLGLAFCKLAVEAHGGSIQVDSREGQGSRFSVTLPKAEEQRKSHA